MITSDDKRFRIEKQNNDVCLFDGELMIYSLCLLDIPETKALQLCKNEAEFLSSLPWRLNWVEA